jgi:excisionase family DNA binding protein
MLDHIAYSIAEASRLTSLSRATIYRRMRSGALTSVKSEGRRLLTREDIDAFLNRGRQTTTSSQLMNNVAA